MKLRNKYFIMRHGQAKSNVKALCSSYPETFKNPLTKIGKETVRESVNKFGDLLKKREETIDLIFVSPLLRTQQTAEIANKKFKAKIKTDKRLREVGFGIFSGGPLEKMWKHFKNENERIKQKPPKGESYEEILKRVMSFLKDAEKKYKDKNILIVSHEGPLFLLQGKVMGLTIKETIKKFPLEKRIHKTEIRELN